MRLSDEHIEDFSETAVASLWPETVAEFLRHRQALAREVRALRRVLTAARDALDDAQSQEPAGVRLERIESGLLPALAAYERDFPKEANDA